MQELTIRLASCQYPIYLERGVLDKIGSHVNLDREVLVITDDGVPAAYAQRVLAQCPQGQLFTVGQGEGAKSFPVWESILEKMLEMGFSRKSLVMALGGGVMGDLSGFAAACYMRGIDYVGIPTTTLSQIDSSIGGKTAVNMAGAKNVVGAFHHPIAVFVDPDTLATLPRRHFINGLAEAVKAGLIADPALFALFEEEDWETHLEEILLRSLRVKQRVVQEDERESGLRKILNFGHTLGHGIESACHLGGLYHGECVALGMLPMLEDEALRQRVLAVYRRLGLPTQAAYDPDAAYAAMVHDKKAASGMVTVVKVARLGEARLEQVPMASLRALLEGGRV